MTTIEKLITIGLTGFLAYSVLKNDQMNKKLNDMGDEYSKLDGRFHNFSDRFWEIVYEPATKFVYKGKGTGRIVANMTSDVVVDTFHLYRNNEIEVANETEE